ncbi:MAG: methionyl-tRNA formyltransferase [Bacteroidia bacterium]|nr:methionyl-tRNA formyltransferase [Bacteroidia bacterium]MDW8134298.1 methionyl-tRNA formyltransferase [Bacteroidia bacterium]
MRVVFFGNGAFGLPALRRLATSPHKVMAVITNPDKPAGRGQRLMPTPIKEEAQRLGLPIWEVEYLRDADFLSRLQALNAHIFVVVAYRILPREVWSIPPSGAINIHPSLLPAYRGAAPIQWSIMKGETTTGITIFRIQEGVDTGDIFLQRAYPLPYEWNAGQLECFLSEVGADLLLEALEGIAMGTIQPKPQPKLPEAPYAPKITPQNTRIQWNSPAEEVYNFIRGLSPSPKAWTIFQGKRLHILQAAKVTGRRTNRPPATLWQENGELLVSCQDVPLRLLRVQLEGKRPVSGHEFAQGYVKGFTLSLE